MKSYYPNNGIVFSEFHSSDEHAATEEYVLSAFRINDKIYACLISKSDGNRWNEPVEITRIDTITMREMNRIASGFNDVRH